MATLERRIAALEDAVPSGRCHWCSLQFIMGDTSIGDTCLHAERPTYEEALLQVEAAMARQSACLIAPTPDAESCIDHPSLGLLKGLT